MQAKIVIITSHFLRSFVEQAFAEMNADCEIQIAEYTHFNDLSDIYRRCEPTADAFLISGTAALSVIKHDLGPLKKPIISFHADLISFYHALITLFIERRDLSPRRAVFDFLLPISEDATVDHLVHDIKLSELGTQIEAWVDENVGSRSTNVELTMAQKCMELWECGEIDMVLCLYSSIIPFLEQSKIPYYFVYPVREQLKSQVDQLLSRLQLEQMHDNLPAVIAVAPHNSDASPSMRQRIKKALNVVARELLIDMIVQETDGHFYIFTSCKTISVITDNLRICPLMHRFKEQSRLSVAVGYGIGRTVAEAKEHADTALKEALFSGASFVMDEKKTLLGPLDSERFLHVSQTISDQVYELSSRCRLSTLTIQKLIAVTQMTGSTQITTQELAEHTGVSIRNANRILKSLEQGGAAAVAYTRSATTKGRPVKVYQLAFPDAQSPFS